MSLKRVPISAILACATVGLAVMTVLSPAMAQISPPAPASDATSPELVLRSFQHRADGTDRVFNLGIENVSGHDAILRGRLVAISVYDTTQPTVMPLEPYNIAAGGTQRVEVRWVGAPAVGRVRALLVLSGDSGSSYVRSFDFWLLPYDTILWAGLIAAMVVLVGLLMWRRRRLVDFVPSNMTVYWVEYDDTIMSVSNRYGVSWEAVVKANRLKPPYELKPGGRLLIPKHKLVRPVETNPKP